MSIYTQIAWCTELVCAWLCDAAVRNPIVGRVGHCSRQQEGCSCLPWKTLTCVILCFTIVVPVIILIIVIIYRFKFFWGRWNRSNRPNARVILLVLNIWCWGTPSTVVFRVSGSTATRSPRKHFTAVTGWPLSWFVRQASRLESSWSRQIPSGTIGFNSFFQPLQTQTPDWSYSTVHWSLRLKPMTIPKPVIIVMIYIMLVIAVIEFLC
jgi:hypothetical protein